MMLLLLLLLLHANLRITHHKCSRRSESRPRDRKRRTVHSVLLLLLMVMMMLMLLMHVMRSACMHKLSRLHRGKWREMHGGHVGHWMHGGEWHANHLLHVSNALLLMLLLLLLLTTSRDFLRRVHLQQCKHHITNHDCVAMITLMISR